MQMMTMDKGANVAVINSTLSTELLQIYYNTDKIRQFIMRIMHLNIIQAIIGPSCDKELIETGRLSYFWDIPVFARVASDPIIGDPFLYPTVVKCSLSSTAGLSHALKEFANFVNLSEITLISSKASTLGTYPIAKAIHTYLELTKLLQVKKLIVIDEENWLDKEETINVMLSSTRCMLIMH
uniref:ANF_receptor domain-containing protein n=1 Tax=Ascaris lumbricoides TaxID=6252 RepID=A0A0M3IU26_ASCLU